MVSILWRGGWDAGRRNQAGVLVDFDFQRTKDRLLAEVLRDAIVATGVRCTAREIQKASGADGQKLWKHLHSDRPDLKKSALTRALNTALDAGLLRVEVVNSKRSEICPV